MHLVFLNQYYPPDAAPTGVMLQAVAEELVRQGHAVTVICASGRGYSGDGGGTSNIERPTSNVEGGEEDRLTAKTPRSPKGIRSGDNGEDRVHEIGRMSKGQDVPSTNWSETLQLPAEPGIDSALSSQPSTLNPQLSYSASCSRPSTSSDLRPAAVINSPLQVLRIRASRFGRGTFLGKLMDYGSFYLGAIWKLLWLKPRPDRIVALTTPPYVSVLARALSKLRGGDHGHWVMDLYPDVMAAHGMLRETSLVYRILRRISAWGMGGRRCAAVVTLGPDMARKVARLRCQVFREGEAIEREGEGTSNSERPTSNIEGEIAEKRGARSGEGREEDDGDIAAPYGEQLSTNPPIHWIPLWGGGETSDRFGIGGGENDEGDGPRPVRGDEEGDGDLDKSEWSGRMPRPVSGDEEGDGDITAPYRAEDELVVMYSGNMGLGHRFGEILEVAAMQERSVGGPRVRLGGEAQDVPATGSGEKGQDVPATGIRFVFFGGGRRRGEIERSIAAHPGGPVELHHYVAADELAAHLRSADVHLVSLEPAWTGTMVPSKLQGIFAVGRPVIFIGSAESSIGRWVAESGGGWVVPAGDVDALWQALGEACDPAVREARGAAALAFSRIHFDKRTNVRRVAEILSRQRMTRGTIAT